MARMQVCHHQLPYLIPQNFVHWDPFLLHDGCQQLNHLNIQIYIQCQHTMMSR
jgi:hypothetical protein